MKNKNYLNLTTQVTMSIFKDKGLMVVGLITLIINAIMVYFTIEEINNIIFNELVTYFEIIVLSLIVSFFIGVFSILVIVKIFSMQLQQKIITLEKHTGYSNKQIYLARITAFLIVLFAMILLVLLINFIGFWFSITDEINTKIFFAITGWYLFFALIIATITTLLSLCLKQTYLITVTIILNMIILTVMLCYNFIFPEKIISGQDLERLDKSLIANDYYENSIKEEISSNQDIKIIFDQVDELIALLPEKSDSPNKINEMDFLMGPKYWFDTNKIENIDAYKKLAYAEMADYFYEIFKLNDEFKPAFENVTNFDDDDRTRDVNFKPFYKFLRKNNQKYPEINNLIEIYWKNNFAKSGAGTIDRVFSTQGIFIEGLIGEMKKSYENSGEFMFFQTFNKILLSHYNQKLNETENYFELFNEFFKNEFLLNVANPIGHFNLMFYCQYYGDDWIYYEVLNSSLIVPKKINLKVSEKTLEDGSKMIVYKQAIWIEVLYTVYTVILILTMYGAYFPFKKKISN